METSVIVEDILDKHQVSGPAVDVFRIIEESNIELIFEAMDDNDSGFLLIEDGNATIAINSTHHPNRQRFTAAHEYGHYCLHSNMDKDQLFVDQAFQRDVRASAGTDYKEIQANQFAAELLMPKVMVHSAIANMSLSDLDIALLALRFEVSEQAMTLRLVNLNLLKP